MPGAYYIPGNTEACPSALCSRGYGSINTTRSVGCRRTKCVNRWEELVGHPVQIFLRPVSGQSLEKNIFRCRLVHRTDWAPCITRRPLATALLSLESEAVHSDSFKQGQWSENKTSPVVCFRRCSGAPCNSNHLTLTLHRSDSRDSAILLLGGGQLLHNSTLSTQVSGGRWGLRERA